MLVALKDPAWSGRVLRDLFMPGIVRWLYVDGCSLWSRPGFRRLSAHVIGDRPCRARWQIELTPDDQLPSWITDASLDRPPIPTYGGHDR